MSWTTLIHLVTFYWSTQIVFSDKVFHRLPSVETLSYSTVQQIHCLNVNSRFFHEIDEKFGKTNYSEALDASKFEVYWLRIDVTPSLVNLKYKGKQIFMVFAGCVSEFIYWNSRLDRN